MTVVAAVIVVIVNEPDAGTGPESVPAAAPSFEPIPESIADSIPEPVTVALSRPIPPDERPGNVAVIAVPSPGQVEAEGRKDWPEAAFSVWVECTDLMSRKDFDQAISRMNEVAARSTDRDVRAVTATCRATAKVNSGNADDAKRDFEEAKRDLESLPRRAELELSFTVHLAEMTDMLAGAGNTSSAEDGSRLEKITSVAAQLRKEGDALSDDASGTSDHSTRAATGVAMGLSLCAGAGGGGRCQQFALVATAAVPQAFATTMTAVIRAVSSRSGPVNPPAPAPTATTTTTTGAQVTTTEPSTTEVPPTAAATTTTMTTRTTTTAPTTTTKPPTTTATTAPTTTRTTAPTTTTRRTTSTTTTRRTTSTTTTVTTTTEVDGGG
jgi:hypothetical protein